jgi:hypothetical protein
VNRTYRTCAAHVAAPSETERLREWVGDRLAAGAGSPTVSWPPVLPCTAWRAVARRFASFERLLGLFGQPANDCRVLALPRSDSILSTGSEATDSYRGRASAQRTDLRLAVLVADVARFEPKAGGRPRSSLARIARESRGRRAVTDRLWPRGI